MRFLHTSDWHVGKTLKTRSRLDEHASVLKEILDIAQHENVDALLVTGDLFDSAAPLPDADRLVYDFFSGLCGLHIPAVVIGGNHDHPRRLRAIREILSRLDIHIRPEPARPDSGGVVYAHAGRRNGPDCRTAVRYGWQSQRRRETHGA